MGEKRITKKDRFAELRVLADEAGKSDLVDFIDHEVALLEKKHTKSGAPTKGQLENEVVKATIASTLAESEPMKATDIGNEVGISVQKATALLKQMVEDGIVRRVPDGKVTKFTL